VSVTAVAATGTAAGQAPGVTAVAVVSGGSTFTATAAMPAPGVATPHNPSLIVGVATGARITPAPIGPRVRPVGVAGSKTNPPVVAGAGIAPLGTGPGI
jgi:hypothetical protein